MSEQDARSSASSGSAILVVALLAPLLFSTYWVSALLTQMLLLGIVAASLIFLSAYGGMVSLAQVAIYGIAGFVFGNVVTNGNTKGLNLGWNPWLGVILAIVIASGVGLLFGALASRSFGIYFLMITLTFGVIANLFFGQVTDFSGFGGISGIPAPGLIGPVDAHPNRLYYVALGTSLVVLLLLQVRRADSVRARAAGSPRRPDPDELARLQRHAPPHARLRLRRLRRVARRVLFVWWNGHIDPASDRPRAR